jgi:uncharacterized protein (DUF433 family)
MSMSPVSHQHIAMMPSALHGEKAVIAGTRIRVIDVYVWHVLQGKSAQQIVEEFPHLTLADVYAAMAYYWDNEQLLQEQFQRGKEFADEMQKEYPSKLADAIKRRQIDGDSVSP